MGLAIVPAALLTSTLVTIAVIRSRTVVTRLIGECLLLGAIGGYLLHLGVTPFPSDAIILNGANGTWLRALAVMWWLIGARLVATLTTLFLGRDVRSRQARMLSDLIAGAIYLTAILIILNSILNLPIKGLLATSGIIAIVLGLALQNTLADVFSGVAVGVEQPFHVGNRVNFGDDTEGVIVQINWRSVRIQTDGDDLVTIPNSIVAKSQIINRSFPTERRAVYVDIPTSSLVSSETLIGLVREAILLCPAIMDEPKPRVAIQALGTRKTVVRVKYYVASSAYLSAARGQLLFQARRLLNSEASDNHSGALAPFLASVKLFASLGADEIMHLAEASIVHRIDAGGIIYDQGSDGTSLFTVRSGVFEISRDEQTGDRRNLGRIGPGDFVGELSLLSSLPRSVTVRALITGDVVEIPHAALAPLIGNESELRAQLEQSGRRRKLLLDRRDNSIDRATNAPKTGLIAALRRFLFRRNRQISAEDKVG